MSGKPIIVLEPAQTGRLESMVQNLPAAPRAGGSGRFRRFSRSLFGEQRHVLLQFLTARKLSPRVPLAAFRGASRLTAFSLRHTFVLVASAERTVITD